MSDLIYIEFLVEDFSGKLLLEKIMKKYAGNFNNLSYRINGFKGIGRLPKQFGKINKIKTHALLNDLPAYLKGINHSLSFPGKKAIIVVVDCDDKDCAAFKKELLELCSNLQLDVDTFFCIAIEEMEAWLLGDANAVLTAYPNAKRGMLHNYAPDSIIGTWEYLADAVFPGGVARLIKEAASYAEIGKQKCEWAKRIGEHMDIDNNRSPSFNYLLSKINQICS